MGTSFCCFLIKSINMINERVCLFVAQSLYNYWFLMLYLAYTYSRLTHHFLPAFPSFLSSSPYFPSFFSFLSFLPSFVTEKCMFYSRLTHNFLPAFPSFLSFPSYFLFFLFFLLLSRKGPCFTWDQNKTKLLQQQSVRKFLYLANSLKDR